VDETESLRLFLDEQADLLGAVAAGAPVEPLLESVTRLIERCAPGVLCSLLLVDRERMVLRHAASPSLPEPFRQAIDGTAIGPKVGSCGTSAWSGQPVIVSDIAADPLWEDHAELARGAGLAACWSIPVKHGDEVVATFAAYSRQPRMPTVTELRLLELSVNLVAVVLRREADISHRRSVEGRYQMLIEQLPVVTYQSDGASTVRLYVSPQVGPLLGFSSQELMAPDSFEGWRRLLHPDDREAVMADWQEALRADRTWDCEYRLMRRDGAVIWVRNVDMVVRDEHGRPVGRQGIIFDVTSKVDTLNALRLAEHRYRTLVEQLPAVTYLDGLGQAPSYASPQIEQLVGMPPDRWLTDWEQAIHPDQRRLVSELYHAHVERREPFEIEYVVVRPDGQEVWISERGTPVQDADGGGGYVQGVMFDVTALKNAESAVRESERRFREMLETVQLVAVITEVDGSISFCNDYLAALSGYSAEELQGRNWEELFVPEPERMGRRFFQELRRGRVIPHDTTTMLTRSGELRTITWSSTPLRDAEGRVVSAASIGEDVTDRLRAEQALRESEERRRLVMAEMLRTAEEERNRIATELHDDTVQVMAATLMSLDRVKAAIERDARAQVEDAVGAARATLAAAVDRTRRLMFELRPPLLESQGLDPALRDLAATAAAEEGFEVEASISVGRYPEAVETLAYRTAQEAIANARKHAGARRLALTLTDDDGHLHGEVRDDGRGFDVGQALDRHTMRLHMGLDTMIERVRMAGGEIAVQSQRGDGTTISFRIPAA
jgi:PAS domain S-box-containing protein